TAAELDGLDSTTFGTSAWGGSTYPWGSSPAYTDTVSTGAPGRGAYDDSAIANAYLVPALLVGYDADGKGASKTSNAANATAYNTTNFNPFTTEGGMQGPEALRYVWPIPRIDDVMTSTGHGQWWIYPDTDQAFAIASPGRMYNDRRVVGTAANA